MTYQQYTVKGEPSLVWVYPDSLSERLDSATWIETTRELCRLGWKVTLLTKDRRPGRQSIRGVDTISLGNRNVYLLGQLLFHLKVIIYVLRHWRQVDVVFFTQVSGFWLLIPLRFFRFFSMQKRPLVVMDTRDVNDPLRGHLRIQLRIWFHQLVFFLADIFADGRTAITSRMVELVSIPDRQLLGIWPSGVDPDNFAPAINMRQWPKEDEPLHLMYLGILLTSRHPAELCLAVETANANGMQVHLSLVGDGPDRPSLDHLVEKSDGRVRILPKVPHDQIPEMLAQAHVGVTSLPDPEDVIYEASSPIKLFEYMAAGLPVLATRNVCHTDVVGEGKFAFWADGTDAPALLEAINECWNSRANLAQLGVEAQRSVQNWTWQSAARKLSQALMTGLDSSVK